MLSNRLRPLFICVLVLLTAIASLFGGNTAPAHAFGAISGVVWRDYNLNGVQDALEPGVQYITVSFYDNGGLVAGSPITTDANGNYTFNYPGSDPTVRVEFTGLPAYLKPGAQPAPQPGSNGSTVQFVTFGVTDTANVNLGVQNPSEFCQNNPDVVSTCFVPGPSLGSADPVVVNFQYDAGDPSKSLSVPKGAGPVFDAHDNTGYGNGVHPISVPYTRVGSIYGLAYQRASKYVFASAALKRNSDFGPSGIGAIYAIDTSIKPVPPTATSTFFNFNDINPVLAGDTTGRDFGGTVYQDTWAYNKIGTTSLGGMDILEDATDFKQDALYVVNLQNRTLNKIPIKYDPLTPAIPPKPDLANIKSYPIPGTTLSAPGAPGCMMDDVRPYGLGTHDGKVYVGLVCSAQGSQDVNQLRAYVYSFDPTLPDFTQFSTSPVIELDLGYKRGCASGSVKKPITCGVGKNSNNTAIPWLPSNSIAPVLPNPPTPPPVIFHIQEMLTDIAFNNNDMILGFRDRFGDQYREARTAGDIVLACLVGVVYTLENNGSCGGKTSAGGVANSQGPGGGEFYNNDDYIIYHQELGNGALLQLPGRPDIMTTVFDPVYADIGFNEDPKGDTLNDGGVRRFNNTDGTWSRAYRLYNGIGNQDTNNFGKNNGVGDLEAVCDSAPIEIGNRVWIDTIQNGIPNGIQDPGELPLAGITVQLVDSTNTVIAEALTDGNGNYIFSSGPSPAPPLLVGLSTESFVYDIKGLTPNSRFTVRIPNVSGTVKQAALNPYTLTTQNVNNNPNDTSRNSKGVLMGANADAPVTTGGPGNDDHTIDFGFFAAPPTSTFTPIPTSTTVPSATVTLTSSPTVTPSATLTPFPPTTPLATLTPLSSATASLTSSVTNTASITATPSVTNTAGPSPTASITPTASLTNTAGPSPTNNPPPPTSSNNGTPSVSVGDPQIVKVADVQLAQPGAIVTFTLIVTNQGTAPAASVVVTDPLPNITTFVSASATQGTYSSSGNVVTFNVGTVQPGQVITLHIVARINANVTPPIDITNNAALDWPGGSRRTGSATVHITRGVLPSTGEHPDDTTSSLPLLLISAGVVGAAVYGVIRRRRAV